MPGPWSRAATVANDIFFGVMHPDQEPFAVANAVWEPRDFGRNVFDLGENSEEARINRQLAEADPATLDADARREIETLDPDLQLHLEDVSQYRHHLFNSTAIERAVDTSAPEPIQKLERAEKRAVVEGLARELEFIQTVGQSDRVNDFLILHRSLRDQVEDRMQELDGNIYHTALRDLENLKHAFAHRQVGDQVMEFPLTMDSQVKLHEASIALVQKVKNRPANHLRDPADFDDVIDDVMHHHQLESHTADGSDVRLGLRTLAGLACADEPEYKLVLLSKPTMKEVRVDLREGASNSALGAAFNVLHPIDIALTERVRPDHEDDAKLEQTIFADPNRPPSRDLMPHEASDADLRAYAESLANAPLDRAGQQFTTAALALEMASLCSRRELVSAERYRRDLKEFDDRIKQARADGEITGDHKDKLQATIARLKLPLGPRALTQEARDNQFRAVQETLDHITAENAREPASPASSYAGSAAEEQSVPAWKSFFERSLRRLEALRERGEFHQHVRDAENIRFKADYAVLNNFIIAHDWQVTRADLAREVTANTAARFAHRPNPIADLGRVATPPVRRLNAPSPVPDGQRSPNP